MGPCPNPKACKQQGLFSPSPAPLSPSPSFSQQRSARLKTNKQKNVFRYRQPVPHQIRQMMGFFWGAEPCQHPFKQPQEPGYPLGRPQIPLSVPKSHRPSPKAFSLCVAGAAELQAGLWLGAAPTLPQHGSRRQSLQAFPSSSSSSASPECQRPAPGRLPTRGTEPAADPTTSSYRCWSPGWQPGGTGGGVPREPPRWGRRCSGGWARPDLFIRPADSAARIDAWEKLITARSCGRRAGRLRCSSLPAWGGSLQPPLSAAQ